MQRGPVEVLFLTFPEDVALADIAGILRPPVEAGTIRLIDCVLMARDGAGTVGVRDLEDGDGLPEELVGLDIEPHDLLNDEDIAVFAESLGDGEVGVAVVYEEVWAREAVTRIRALGAEVALFARVAPEDVEVAFAAEEVGA